MRFDSEFIENVKNSNDIVDVVSQYVQLKRSGANYFGCCPFHNEKTPSMSVSREKQMFKCFGCGIGGNVFTFVSQINNLTFVQAVEELANRANISLPSYSSNYDVQKEQFKEKIYKLNDEAAQFYHKRLYDTSVAKQAQEYVKQRKLNNTTLVNFQIGYSGKYDELYNHLVKLGFKEKEILESGLVKKIGENRYTDIYKNRLMFPISDIRGRIIGFGGRVLDDSKPKYINSPENIVYSKSHHLYGLNIAKKENTNKILVVEGYMDVISCHQRGVSNVVAALGTALTDKQIKLLKNKYENIILSFDKDQAGQTAIDRSIQIAKKQGVKPLILQLDEEAKDPDEYMLKFGNARFKYCIDNAISPLEFKVKNLKNNLNLENLQDKLKLVNFIANEISEIDNELEKELYIDKFSKEYNLSKEAIFAQVNHLKYENDNLKNSKNAKLKQNGINQVVPKTQNLKINSILMNLKKRELEILNILIHGNYDIYNIIHQYFDHFEDEILEQILLKVYELYESQKAFDLDVLMQDLSIEQQSIISDVVYNRQQIADFEKDIDNIINSYLKEKDKLKLEQVIEKLSNTNDVDERKSLEKELSILTKKISM